MFLSCMLYLPPCINCVLKKNSIILCFLQFLSIPCKFPFFLYFSALCHLSLSLSPHLHTHTPSLSLILGFYSFYEFFLKSIFCYYFCLIPRPTPRLILRWTSKPTLRPTPRLKPRRDTETDIDTDTRPVRFLAVCS